jgi:hypothetical protein
LGGLPWRGESSAFSFGWEKRNVRPSATICVAAKQETDMIRFSLAALTLIAALSGAAQAQEQHDRLLIVNGNNGRVIYNDGRDDLFCVTRRHFVGYNGEGHRLYHRSMRCR